MKCVRKTDRGVAANVRAEAIQDGVLVPDVVGRAGESRGVARPEIAGVGVAGDEAQSRSLSCPGENERWTGLLSWRRQDPRAIDAVVGPVKGERRIAPDAADDLDLFRQRRLTRGDWREREAELGELGGIPAMSEAENEAAAGEVVEIGRQPRRQEPAAGNPRRGQPTPGGCAWSAPPRR